MYDAYLFDLDGTLIDTESIALKANMEVFAAMGHPVDAAFLHGLIAVSYTHLTLPTKRIV